MKNTRNGVLIFTFGLIVGILTDRAYISTVLTLTTLLIIILMFSNVIVWFIRKTRKNNPGDKDVSELWWIDRTYSLLLMRDKLQLIVSQLNDMLENGKVELFNTGVDKKEYMLKVTRTVQEEEQVFWIPVTKVTEQLRQGMAVNWDELYHQRIVGMVMPDGSTDN